MEPHTSRRSFLQTLSASAVMPLLANTASSQNTKKPNILLIMADDMGFSDAGCYGGEIQTPNIDSLANNGLRFTQFYNCARCCPTRASLMTGQYPHQVGLNLNGQNLSRNGVTIAEALGLAGYNTAMSGKWHLSETKPLKDAALHQKWLDHQYDPGVPFAPVETYPINRGFDRYYGNIWGVVDYFDPFSLVEGEEPIDAVPEDYYITDAINNHAVEYINQLSGGDDPFFLYVAHCAPHWPLHALEEDIEKYKDAYLGGWDELRRTRYERMVKMGLIDEANTPLPPVQSQGMEWDSLTDKEKRFQAGKMAAHAAMVDRMDQGIGRILDALRQNGELDNTVIFFLVDNGASPEIMTRPGYDRTSQTREGEEVLYSGFEHTGPETTYGGIGPAWANANNTPFRYWKKESFEGGCHTPLIVHYPDGLQALGGTMTGQVGHVMDIMPTCLELAGAEYPATYNGHDITPVEGKSLIPIFHGQEREGHDAIFFEHERGRAVRMGDWKLTANSGTPQKWELYHLSEDRTETKDLASEHPERVEEMIQAWNHWAKRVGIL